jgi:hypothetical protein
VFLSPGKPYAVGYSKCRGEKSDQYLLAADGLPLLTFFPKVFLSKVKVKQFSFARVRKRLRGP